MKEEQRDGMIKDSEGKKDRRSVKRYPFSQIREGGGMNPSPGTYKGGHSMTLHRALRQWKQKRLGMFGRWEKLGSSGSCARLPACFLLAINDTLSRKIGVCQKLSPPTNQAWSTQHHFEYYRLYSWISRYPFSI